MLGLELKRLQVLDSLPNDGLKNLHDLMIFFKIAQNKAAVTTKLRPYFG